MSRNNGDITKNFLDYSQTQNYYNLMGIDLSVQKKSSVPQQINLVAKAEEDDGAKNFLIVEKQPKNWNYSGTAGSLWFYFEDDVTNFNKYIANTVDFKFFRYKVKLQGYTEATKTH